MASEWKRDGATVYALNARGVNRWSFNVQEGFDDDDKRIGEDERLAIAIKAAAAPALFEALTEILGPLNVCSDNPNVRDDVCLPIEMTMGELRKARAALALVSETSL